MRNRAPYDCNRLTPAEQAAESMLKKQSCGTCDYLQRHSRSGARLCEVNEDVLAVIKGDKYCEFYLEVKKEETS